MISVSIAGMNDRKSAEINLVEKPNYQSASLLRFVFDLLPCEGAVQ